LRESLSSLLVGSFASAPGTIDEGIFGDSSSAGAAVLVAGDEAEAALTPMHRRTTSDTNWIINPHSAD
jgi:hypothetical protein